MSILKPDHSQASSGEFEPITPGDYEAFISDVEVATFRTGNQGLKVTYTIRDDISGQKFGRRKVFDNMVATEKAEFRFHGLYKGLNITQEFSSLEEIADTIRSQPVQLVIKTESYTNNEGELKKKDAVAAWKESRVPGQARPEANDPFADNGNDTVDIDDSDLPF